MRNLIKIFLLLATVLTANLAQASITVFAAASMTNVLEQIRNAYQQQHPQQEVLFSFASSSTLARQIAQGAPADLFISADQRWMNFLEEKQAIETNTRKNLVKNQLVMIASLNSKITQIDLNNQQWHQYLTDQFLAIGDPKHVPAGIYAKAAFTSLQQWEQLQDKCANANNVRGALALVEQGEAPLGVVYATDAKASNKVNIVAYFPENSHPPIEYPVAIVKDHLSAEVQDFLAFLYSKEAQDIFKQFGFQPFTLN